MDGMFLYIPLYFRLSTSPVFASGNMFNMDVAFIMGRRCVKSFFIVSRWAM